MFEVIRSLYRRHEQLIIRTADQVNEGQINFTT